MKFYPSTNDFFANAFDDFFNEPFFNTKSSIMKTNVHEKDDCYILDMEIPGFNKEDISLELDRGYLSISACKDTNNETKDEQGHIIRQERYMGNMSRRFYVGDHINEEDIKACYDKGELKITIPKATKSIEQKKTIMIE